MNSEIVVKQLDKGLRIVVMAAEDHIARIQGIVARQAFLEGPHCDPGHEVENWNREKSKLVGALSYGLIIHDQDIFIDMEIGEFAQGTVEIWVSPRRITVCGKTCNLREKYTVVCRTVEPPIDTEPLAVSAKLNGSILGICFPKLHMKEHEVRLSAA